jgi:hypothetical protein
VLAGSSAAATCGPKAWAACYSGVLVLEQAVPLVS